MSPLLGVAWHKHGILACSLPLQYELATMRQSNPAYGCQYGAVYNDRKQPCQLRLAAPAAAAADSMHAWPNLEHTSTVAWRPSAAPSNRPAMCAAVYNYPEFFNAAGQLPAAQYNGSDPYMCMGRGGCPFHLINHCFDRKPTTVKASKLGAAADSS